MKKIISFFLLPFREKKTLSHSFILILLIRLGLWVVSYRRLNEFLSYISSPESYKDQPDWQKVKEVAYFVTICARYIPSASCLTQAMAAQTLLNFDRHKSELVIGVDKDSNGKILAHAWIEVEKKIVIGGTADIKRYSILTLGSKQFV